MSKKSNRAVKNDHTNNVVEVVKHVSPIVVEPTTGNEIPEMVLSKEQEKSLEEQKTVSGKIRYLDSLGMKRGQIAKKTGKLYQHVRNVLTTPLKRKTD